MHEFSLMSAVMDAVENSARVHGAAKVLVIRLTIGEMAEVVPEAMEFAFEALSPGTLSEGAELTMTTVRPRSRCAACDAEFEHDRYHWSCPNCDSLATELLAGKELYIESIEIEDGPVANDDAHNDRVQQQSDTTVERSGHE
ncbi:MAG: hydrogenase maturation nickel metallochaperone HypA [Coriobacteriales bacterium]|jgi:hydrogenase nickel incorporation protein HypA/HybF|nr:hydrogenase maturation nickel metallochaperone HypA [Coriobacteriales bacterium]